MKRKLLSIVSASAMFAICAWAPPSQSAESTRMDLEIVLPKPMFKGTPTDIKSDNLEPPLGRARPLMKVPVGTVLLSEGTTVTSSDSLPVIGEIEMVTDGDKEGSDGSFVELGPGLQYVQIDLERQCQIYAVVVWHYHAQGRAYRDVVVRTSDDPDFITNVKDLYNNDHDNSAGLGVGRDKEYVETNEGRLIRVRGSAKARYVRLYSKGNTSNDLNHYVEVDVYGKTVE